MAAQPIPEGSEHLVPSLSVEDAAGAIEFYKQAFGAIEHGRMEGPGGMIAHASLEIHGSRIMLADPFPQSSIRPPKELGATSISLFIYVDNVDAAFQKAINAGATAVMDVQDMFWGDRWGMVADPYGHHWELATHVEDVSQEEMAERGREAMAGMG